MIRASHYLVCHGRFLCTRAAVPLGIAAFPRPLFLEGERFQQKPGRLAPPGVDVRLATKIGNS